MEPDLACARDTTGIFETIQYMQGRKVRRLPIVDERGALLGILSLDDLLELLSEELLAMAKLVGYQRQKETRFRQ
jgi:CBS domain-containing protein